MKYVITGATSFIGIKMINFLLSMDNKIVAVYRQTSLKKQSIPQEVLKIPLDISQYNKLDNYITNADIFIHLAWNGTGHEGRDNTTIQEKNIEHSLEAIKSAHKMGCKLFVFAGSQAEYGHVDGILSEETPCNPQSQYGIAKLKFGEKASKLCKELGIKFIHLRICSIFGEGDHPWTLVMSTIKKMLNNENIELSTCEQFWNFLDVGDAVKQIYYLCQYALNNVGFKSEIFIICSNDTRKLRSFVEEMRILTNSSSQLLYGKYQTNKIVSLNPSSAKTIQATDGFIDSKTFGQVIEKIIENYKNNTI